ncbi:hypothetical protein O181_101120 [Austropuccinia psidii MF-1]|uniref:Uncharacterized protein n=1 Tax=Austropuccinia psidii MF-1 TaxID=1389203 RepID=A0A9Q3JDV6_9BASI|nr:hypothetical protein [Austropuccinia psidii MF-1]
MDGKNTPVTLNIPNSTSSAFLSVEISAMKHLGSFLSVNKVPLAPHHKETQEGTSITSKEILKPTFTGLFDNILQLMIAFSLVQAHAKIDSKTTQKIGKQLVKQGLDLLQAMEKIQDQMRA